MEDAPIMSDQSLSGQSPDTLDRITIIVTNAVTGISQPQINELVVENYWVVKLKNNSRPALLQQPSGDPSENIGWLQRIKTPVGSGEIVMENNPGGIPAEMHYVPYSQSE